MTIILIGKETNRGNKMIKYFDGIPVYIPNTIAEDHKDYYISYCTDTRDYGCVTTALVLNSPNKFLVLEGDHREQYSECDGLERCFEYFKSREDLKSKYSDDI